MKPFPLENPCDASWDAMRPHGSGRHCAACDQPVFDLAALTEQEIRGLVTLSGGQFCARQTLVAGELVTRALAPVPIATPPIARARSTFPMRAAVTAGALGMAACATTNDELIPAPTALAAPTMIACAPEEAGPSPAKGPEPAPRPTPLPAPAPEPSPSEPTIVMAGGIRPQPPGRVFYAHKKVAVAPAMQGILDDAAALLKAQPQIALVAVEGHAALNEGNAKAVAALALARAEAVRAYLVAHGVDATRLRAIGRGATYPMATNDTSEHRAYNRRAELRICGSDADCR